MFFWINKFTSNLLGNDKYLVYVIIHLDTNFFLFPLSIFLKFILLFFSFSFLLELGLGLE